MKLLINSLRFTGIVEGISYLLLLGVAMPLKYAMDWPVMVHYVGAAHGGLFVAYVLLVTVCCMVFRWTWGTFIKAMLASIVPGGTFWMDREFARLGRQIERPASSTPNVS